MEIFLLLMIKHAIIDLGCQPFGLGNHKIKYFGWPAHIKHYIPHGVLTMFVLAFYSSIEVVILLGILDYILHWHTDFLKTNIREYFKWNNTQRQFWLLNTADQILHFLGYYVIILIAT